MHRLYTPAPPLSAFIRCFWYFQGDPLPHARERLLPTGEASIVFNLRDEPMRIYDGDGLRCAQDCGVAALTGPRTGCVAIDSSSEDHVIGVQFRPGGTFPFFREPAFAMSQQSMALDLLWGGAAGLIREQLLEAGSVDAMFLVLERGLLAQLARPLALHPAVEFARARICRAPQVATVSGLLEQIGLSQRRVIDLFHGQIGLTPKAFCRVRRFQGVLRTVHQRQTVDWAAVALDGGYYDQAHLIHEFGAFSGLTPSAYMASATEHLNHVPLD